MMIVTALPLKMDIASDHLSESFGNEGSLIKRVASIGTGGKFFTLAPVGICIEKKDDLKKGGLLPCGKKSNVGAYTMEKVSDTAANLAELISLISEEMRGATLYAKEAYPGQPSLKYDLQFCIGESCYFGKHISGKRDNLEIERMLNDFKEVWSFNILLLKGIARNISEDMILPRCILAASVGFDGESFVCWVNDHASPIAMRYSGRLRPLK